MIKKIPVCILLNDRIIPLWIFTGISDMVASEGADITLIIDKMPVSRQHRSMSCLPGILMLRLIDKIDWLIFRSSKNYNSKRDVSQLHGLTGVVEAVTSHETGDEYKDRLTTLLETLKPDVIIKFGEHYLSKKAIRIAEYGVWTFSVDSDAKTAGFDYGFWEVIRQEPVSFSSVELIMDDQKACQTIMASVESTCPFSINKNRNKVFFRTSLFPRRLIEGLQASGTDYLARQIERFSDHKSQRSDSRTSLKSFALLRVVFMYLYRVSRFVINKFLYTDAFRWRLMINLSAGGNRYSIMFEKFSEISSPPGVFWADPFIVWSKGMYYIFVEEFVYRKNKAHISVLELDSNGLMTGYHPVIVQGYHMSYPFIFRLDEDYFMIPETASNNTIELYRCTSFPDIWEFDRIMMKDVSATDSTLFNHNGRWWLFTTLDKTGSVSGGSTELYLFYTDHPLSGNWISHPLNPVVSDERSARCAGNLFTDNGVIYRPAQDCTIRYGRGFSLRRVTLLNETEYNEILETEIKPVWDKNLKGTHTFNFDNGMTIIDVYDFHGRLSSN